jgi:RNA polymerase sigma factor (sigma-70 family)
MPAKPFGAVIRYLHAIAGSGSAEPSDADLLAHFAAERDPAAFEALVRRHGPLVMGVCRRALGGGDDADDAFQATFLVFARKAQRVRNRESLGSWLHGVAHHLSQQLLHKKAIRRRREKPLGATAEGIAMNADPAHQASLRELGAILDEELRRLPAACRAALVACHLEGLTTAEAAHQLGVPASTVKSRLTRGRELLRRRLSCRGVGLSTVALAVLLGEQSRVRAGAALIQTTVEAGMRFAATGTAAVSIQAAALAGIGLRTTALGKVKLVVVILAICGLVGLGATLPRSSAPAANELADETGKMPAAAIQQNEPLPEGAVGRLGSTRLRHMGPAVFVGFLPDSKTLVSAGRDATIRLWDVATGKMLQRFDVGFTKSDARPPRIGWRHGFTVAMSADAKTVAACWYQVVLPSLLNEFADTKEARDLKYDGPCVQRWDLATGKELPPLVGLDKPALAIAFSPDGRRLATSTFDGAVKVWNVATGMELDRFGEGVDSLGREIVNNTCRDGLMFTPDGSHLLITISDSSKRLTGMERWDIAAKKQVGQTSWDARTTRVPQMFADEGNHLFLTTSGGDILEQEVATGLEVRKLPGQLPSINGLARSPDGKRFYSRMRGDPTILEWDVATGKELRRLAADARKGLPLQTDGNEIWHASLAVSPDGRLLATAGEGAVIRVYDLATGKETFTDDDHVYPPNAVFFTPDNKALWTWSGDGAVHQWDATTGKAIHRVTVNADASVLAISADGVHFASQLDDGSVVLNELSTGKQLGQFGKTGLGNALLAFSTNGRKLAFGNVAEENTAIFDVPPKGNANCVIGGVPKNKARPIKLINPTFLLSPDGSTFVAHSEENKLGIWETTRGRLLHQIDPILPSKMYFMHNYFAFSPNGRTLAAIKIQRASVLLFETLTAKERCRPFEAKPQQEGVSQLLNWGHAWPNDEIRGKSLTTPSGNHRLAISPNGCLLACVDDLDHTVVLWDVVQGKIASRLAVEPGSVRAVAFSPDSKRLATTGNDTTVLLWDVAKVAPLAVTVKRMDRGDLDQCWQELASADAAKAWKAICDLSAAQTDAVAWIGEKVQPAVPIDGKRAQELIGKLDDAQFKIRELAAAELFKLGEQVVPVIDKALAVNPALETVKRLETIRDKFIGVPPGGEKLRVLRAVEVLERIGTPEARHVLQALAAGAPSALVTKAAEAALKR